MLIRRLDAREPGFATEQRFGIALGAYILERVGEIVRNPREPLEIARDQRLRLVGGDFEPAGEAPARNAVEDREIHRLRLAARVAVDLAEQFDRRRRVDVLTLREGLLELGDVGHMRREPKFDLAILGRADDVAGRSADGVANLAEIGRTAGR